MLSSISLKFTEHPPLVVDAGGVIIFVGPNNSGKSLILREIEQALTESGNPARKHILLDYTITQPTSEDILKLIEKSKKLRHQNLPENQVTLGRISPNGGVESNNFDRDGLLANVASGDKSWISYNILRWGLLRLDGRSRFNLTNDQQMGDLLGPPGNVFTHLFQDDEARARVRNIIKDAFGVYLVLDPTNGGYLRMRVSLTPPSADEQSLNSAAREYYSQAVHIKEASDGVQAFCGIVAAVFSGEFHTILIDEPEAFLHPPLARKLGKHLARLAAERGGTLLASTHSADFLMGCVQATSQVKVVRLEYNGEKSRGRMIDSSRLGAFFKRPLMRSTNVVSGIFHDGVVVLESDNDRAFYGEIYHRMTERNPGYPSLLFVNAQNKQTMKDIIGPLRSFGVPAAGIPDIDILKDGGSTWTDWLSTAGLPQALHLGYGQQREAIKGCFSKIDKDMKAEGGIAVLPASDQNAANELFDRLNEYGIFPVRGGEMESWLTHLGIRGKKTDWTVAMLERLGSDPASANYVHPSDDDVWAFMAEVIQWIRNPARKGLP
jgi:ABC-type phosphate/phosphonate transport system ATPase subunit